MIRRLRQYLSGDHLGPTLVKAVTGSAGLRIVGMGFGFLVGVQLARGLGAEGYGTYGVAMSIIALLTVPTEFGLPQLLTREVAVAQVRQDWGRLKGVLRWSSRVSLLIAAVIAVAVTAWLLLSGIGLSSQLGMTLLMGVAMMPLVAQLSLRSAVLRGLQYIVRGQLPDVLLRPMLYSLLLFALPWLMPLNPTNAMGLGVMSASLALLFAWRMLREALPNEVRAANASMDAKNWWFSALPMAATSGLGVLRGNLLILIIGALLTESDAGHYKIAISILALALLPVSLLNTVAAPLISSLREKGSVGELKRLMFIVPAGSALGIFLLSLPLLLSGELVIGTIFGDEFQPAAGLVIILCLGLIISNMFGGNVVLLNMTGYQKDVTVISSVSLLAMAILSFFLVKSHGLHGGAIAYVASNIISDMLMWAAAKRRLTFGASIFLAWGLRRADRQ